MRLNSNFSCEKGRALVQFAVERPAGHCLVPGGQGQSMDGETRRAGLGRYEHGSLCRPSSCIPVSGLCRPSTFLTAAFQAQFLEAFWQPLQAQLMPLMASPGQGVASRLPLRAQLFLPDASTRPPPASPCNNLCGLSQLTPSSWRPL